MSGLYIISSNPYCLNVFAGKEVSKELSGFFENWVGLRYEDTGWPILTYLEINIWMIKSSDYYLSVWAEMRDNKRIETVKLMTLAGKTKLESDLSLCGLRETLDYYILYYLHEIRDKQKKVDLFPNERILFSSESGR